MIRLLDEDVDEARIHDYFIENAGKCDRYCIEAGLGAVAPIYYPPPALIIDNFYDYHSPFVPQTMFLSEVNKGS